MINALAQVRRLGWGAFLEAQLPRPSHFSTSQLHLSLASCPHVPPWQQLAHSLTNSHHYLAEIPSVLLRTFDHFTILPHCIGEIGLHSRATGIEGERSDLQAARLKIHSRPKRWDRSLYSILTTQTESEAYRHNLRWIQGCSSIQV